MWNLSRREEGERKGQDQLWGEIGEGPRGPEEGMEMRSSQG